MWRWITAIFFVFSFLPFGTERKSISSMPPPPPLHVWTHHTLATNRASSSFQFNKHQNSIFNEHFQTIATVCRGLTEMCYCLYTFSPLAVAAAQRKKKPRGGRINSDAEITHENISNVLVAFGSDYRLLSNLFVLVRTRNLQSKHRRQPTLLFQYLRPTLLFREALNSFVFFLINAIAMIACIVCDVY